MKKIISLISIIAILATSIFIFSGCGNKEENKGGKEESKETNKVEISTEFFKGTLKLSVPKNEDGTPKYEFTKEKPATATKFANGTYYLETDKAVITFASKGLVYNTSKDYKAKYGEVKATFQGYLDFMNDPSSTIPKDNTEVLEINGRKAVKRPSRQGSSGDYKYFGYYYMVEADEVVPGSYVEIGVFYKGEEEHKSADPIDDETQAILNSYSLKLNE